MEDYDAQFPRGSCRRDSRDDRLAYAKTLSGGVLALRKAPNVRFAPDTRTSPTTTTLKLLEWDYVIGQNDMDEATHPDLDDPEASEIFFTVGGARVRVLSGKRENR
eukprot:SAG31_NODE_913_length_11064_cov_4.529594_2_plen_106_part_00